MATYKYNKYKILISTDSKKTQGLQIGDVVRRQYFDNPNLIYSLMVVLETGIDVIGGKDSPYFIGALIEGDEPRTGELLDFVRVTNLFNTDRSGALYLTASDSQAPYMDIIDGLAYENSLCYPYMAGGNSTNADKNKYTYTGSLYLVDSYKAFEQDTRRIYRLTRKESSSLVGKIGFMLHIEKKVENPQRLLISFKSRASKQMKTVPISFGYTNLQQNDASDSIDIATTWKYNLFMLTVDYPAQNQRSFFIDITKIVTNFGDWCEIADLNIVLQSDIATFANATKARIGKIAGIIDPIFGVLDGYGAYFQNLYATKNVNIAGTLTAGDENGFSSTFYVGKIHKNVILNSIACQFTGNGVSILEESTPVGIGKVCLLGKDSTLKAQTGEWRKAHLYQKYCISFWAKASTASVIQVYQDGYKIGSFEIGEANIWQRYHASFLIQDAENSSTLNARIVSTTTTVKISAPQLEAGVTPSQYQPTDGTLSVVEDYGAWFSKGGIGGTIQNPLLKLNENGSISSRDNSFVINPDGTGHFANGRFKWSQDKITLQDVIIKWEDLDDNAKDNLSPITIDIVSKTGFTIKNNSNNIDATANLYRNGQLLDVAGTVYVYTWTLWDSTGTRVVKIYNGKSITVDKKEVINMGALCVEVAE